MSNRSFPAISPVGSFFRGRLLLGKPSVELLFKGINKKRRHGIVGEKLRGDRLPLPGERIVIKPTCLQFVRHSRGYLRGSRLFHQDCGVLSHDPLGDRHYPVSEINIFVVFKKYRKKP
ncbi:hypothetical protein [Picosynechococcus sp. PCC 7003]|uniref:hypothetical protein n=1 Tax=Picosynechococcus sp. PCC 7003 TaxID=374981 RepID=UPI0018DD99DF|nr:hypothetical protein [Picosynechococcus sp. PCC 7003]